MAGEADAILSERIALTSWLLERAAPGRCRNFTFSAGVNLAYGNPRQIFLAVNRSYGFEFFSNLQVGLGWLRQKAPASVIQGIYQRELRIGEACPPLEDAADSDRIGLRSQLGVFVIFGAFVGAAVVAAAAETWAARRRAARGSVGVADGGADMTDGDMLRAIYQDGVRRRELQRRQRSGSKVGAEMADGGKIQPSG